MKLRYAVHVPTQLSLQFFRNISSHAQSISNNATDKKPISVQANKQSQIVAEAFQALDTLLNEKPKMCSWDVKHIDALNLEADRFYSFLQKYLSEHPYQNDIDRSAFSPVVDRLILTYFNDSFLQCGSKHYRHIRPIMSALEEMGSYPSDFKALEVLLFRLPRISHFGNIDKLMTNTRPLWSSHSCINFLVKYFQNKKIAWAEIIQLQFLFNKAKAYNFFLPLLKIIGPDKMAVLIIKYRVIPIDIPPKSTGDSQSKLQFLAETLLEHIEDLAYESDTQKEQFAQLAQTLLNSTQKKRAETPGFEENAARKHF